MDKTLNSFYLLVIMGVVLPFVLFALFISYISGVSFLFPLIIVLYLILGALLVMKFFALKRHKKMIHRFALVAVGMSLIWMIPGIYDKTRPVIQDGYIEVFDYAPFGVDSIVVSLPEPSTFKIEDNLPIIDGATALYPVYSAFAQAVYPEKEYDTFDSEVMSNMTDVAYENLIDGRVDMIFAAVPSKDQVARAKENNSELKLTPIGKEAFVFFVNSKNPVKSLTVDEIKGIYAGDIVNWSEVGGKKKSIRAFQRSEGSGSQSALQHFMEDVPIMDPPVEDIASLMGTILDEVSDYKNYNNAIGYTFRYYSTEMTKNENIRLLAVNDVKPTKETIRSGDYPITNEIYAITAGSKNPHLEDFLEWILSDQGQEIIEETGYVSIE